MVTEVKTKKDLKRFINFVKILYKDDLHYVYPLFYVLYQELKSEVLIKKKYKALLYLDGKDVLGRLLYTFEYNHKTDKLTCYFSFSDTVNDQLVFDELFAYMEKDMIDNDVFYSEGSFRPFDPDNRRGILVKGFDDDPVVFTSYNYPYYESLFENYGFKKIHDTVSLQPEVSEENKRKLSLLSKFFTRRFNVIVSPIDLKDIESEIKDIHKILSIATTDIIYQEAPSIDLITSVAKNLKRFLRPEIILIAREAESLEPIGFAICLLDYNQLIKKTKGKLNIFKFMKPLKYIDRSRGMMQYVVPKYQGTGLIGYMYYLIFESFKSLGIKRFEAGTIMEENLQSIKAFDKFGGEVKKIYRIYGKEIKR